jgi:hypothetical protein
MLAKLPPEQAGALHLPVEMRVALASSSNGSKMATGPSCGGVAWLDRTRRKRGGADADAVRGERWRVDPPERLAFILTVGGNSNPSAFEVFRLMTNSNLVGCTTGNNTGP